MSHCIKRTEFHAMFLHATLNQENRIPREVPTCHTGAREQNSTRSSYMSPCIM